MIINMMPWILLTHGLFAVKYLNNQLPVVLILSHLSKSSFSVRVSCPQHLPPITPAVTKSSKIIW